MAIASERLKNKKVTMKNCVVIINLLTRIISEIKKNTGMEERNKNKEKENAGGN